MSDKKTVEQLEKELEASQDAVAKSKTIAEAAEKESVACKTKLEEVSAENEKLVAENKELKKSNAELKTEIERLLETKDTEETNTGVGEIFTFGKGKYKILSSAIRIPGLGKRTALEIMTDSKAQEWLVTNGSGSIKKVV